MLKFIFWTLLLINGALFGYHQGYLDSLIPSGREPARLAQQLNADKIRLLPANAKATNANATDHPAAVKPADNPADPAAGQPAAKADTTDAATPATAMDAASAAMAETKTDAGAPPAADKKPELLACTEIGNFSEADAGRFEARLAALMPDARLSRRLIREASSYMVFIPPQGSKESADRKVEQLRSLGVTDFYVIQDQSDMRWGVSLGIFSSEESAKKRLEQLKQQGVRTARIGARSTISRVAVQLRALDAAGREKLVTIKADFPQQQQRNCL